jgi:PTEN induced putative kinase 1
LKDLPLLKNYELPEVVHSLVKSMLHRNPSKRLSAEEAATICQLLLWAPKSWTVNSSLPSSQDILQWSLTMTTKVLYESRFSNATSAHREYQLVATFLSRLTVANVKSALKWIRDRQ